MYSGEMTCKRYHKMHFINMSLFEYTLHQHSDCTTVDLL